MYHWFIHSKKYPYRKGHESFDFKTHDICVRLPKNLFSQDIDLVTVLYCLKLEDIANFNKLEQKS